jgi:hypothetical protein
MKWIKTYIIVCLNIFVWIWICDMNNPADFFVGMVIAIVFASVSFLILLFIFKKLR